MSDELSDAKEQVNDITRRARNARDADEDWRRRSR